jgi:hypothetical protein
MSRDASACKLRRKTSWQALHAKRFHGKRFHAKHGRARSVDAGFARGTLLAWHGSRRHLDDFSCSFSGPREGARAVDFCAQSCRSPAFSPHREAPRLVRLNRMARGNPTAKNIEIVDRPCTTVADVQHRRRPRGRLTSASIRVSALRAVERTRLSRGLRALCRRARRSRFALRRSGFVIEAALAEAPRRHAAFCGAAVSRRC